MATTVRLLATAGADFGYSLENFASPEFLETALELLRVSEISPAVVPRLPTLPCRDSYANARFALECSAEAARRIEAAIASHGTGASTSSDAGVFPHSPVRAAGILAPFGPAAARAARAIQRAATHCLYRPGGPGYFAAQADFEALLSRR